MTPITHFTPEAMPALIEASVHAFFAHYASGSQGMVEEQPDLT